MANMSHIGILLVPSIPQALTDYKRSLNILQATEKSPKAQSVMVVSQVSGRFFGSGGTPAQSVQ